MTYKDINVTSSVINIGHIGDNIACHVIFDISEILSTWGADGEFTLLNKPNNKGCDDLPYPVEILEVDISGNKITWTPTATDTSNRQYSYVELVYVVGEQVVYNKLYKTVSEKSLAGDQAQPPSWDSWITQVLQSGAESKTSAEAAAASAESASSSAESAAGSAEAAAESESNASDYASEAETAAAAAQQYADSVTTATVAETKTYLGI